MSVEDNRRPGPAPSQDEGAPRGYVSHEAKGGYLTKMWVAAITCLVGQFVLPSVVSFMAMQSMFEQVSNVNNVDPSRSACWKGSVWMLETGFPRSDGLPGPVKISRWVPGSEGPPTEAKIPPMYEPSLLATGGSLWVIGADTVVEISDRGTAPTQIEGSLGPVSRPFAFRGRPALIERGAERYLLKIFDGVGWVEDAGFSMGPTNADEIALELLVVLDGPDGPGAALAYDGALYYLNDLRRLGLVPVADWERVDDLKLYWVAAVVGGTPTIFRNRNLGLDGGIDGYSRGPGGWEKNIEIEHGIAGRMGICQTETADRYLLLAEGMPGSVTVWEMSGSTVLSKTKIGEDLAGQERMNTLSWISNGLGWFTTVAMILILATLMKRARVGIHLARDRSARYASVLRRAIASALDMAIMAAPLVALWFLWVGPEPFNLEDNGTSGAMRFMGFAGIAFVWVMIWIVLFALMESRRGQTPGKWLTGIVVLTVDLQPCGFGKAMIRNLLKIFGDSFFSFLVGIVFIAVTPSWQRVGDLAGRTVVVRVE